MNEPIISIIMPVKDGANYLSEALTAIKAQKVNSEIIVVDDGSKDNTAQIATDFGCVVIKHEVNKGLVASKNTALKVARGKYIMFHDHDDVMNQDVLEKMLKELEENEEISAVMAHLLDFFSSELSAEDRKKVAIREQPYSHLFSGAILMKKEIFDKIGLFNENLKAGDAIDWQVRMDKHGLQVKKLDFVATNRRLHNSNFGRTNRGREYQDYAAILRSKIRGSLVA